MGYGLEVPCRGVQKQKCAPLCLGFDLRSSAARPSDVSQTSVVPQPKEVGKTSASSVLFKDGHTTALDESAGQPFPKPRRASLAR